MGAHACVTEMITSNPKLYTSNKTRFRRDLSDELYPRIVQIAGADPDMMADAATHNIALGADVIDINMGCPAKKVCNVMAGSSLLKNEILVAKILEKVVMAADVPVTLKIRTGWDKTDKNALNIAKIAEDSGIQCLTIHGRTRACRFSGKAEHDTTAEIKSRVSIKVIANGDIHSIEDALRVLRQTGADGIMIGRAAMGNPWIFKQVSGKFKTGESYQRPDLAEIKSVVINHLHSMYDYYGEYKGVRIARKHIYWYCGKIPGFEKVRLLIGKEENCYKQLQYVEEFLSFSDLTRLAA